MTQDERWLVKYRHVVEFIQTNHRNPSKHDPEERGQYLNWIKHNRRLLKSGDMKQERVEKFNELLVIIEEFKHKNQWV